MTDTRCVLRDASPDDAERLSHLALRSKAHRNYPPEFLAACRAELTYTPQDIRAPNASFVIAEIVIQGDPNAAGFYRPAGAEPDGERESDSIPGRYLPLFVIELG